MGIKKWWEKIINNTVLIYSKHITNLSTFYLFIFSVSWLILYYKLQKIQIDLNTNKYLYVNTCINEYVLITKGEHQPPENQIFNATDTLSKNNLNINEWYTHCVEKNKLNKNIGIWNEDYDFWKKYKIEFEKNSPEVKKLLKNNIIILNNNIESNNSDYLNLKKTSLKLILGLGLLIYSDFLLKSIFC